MVTQTDSCERCDRGRLELLLADRLSPTDVAAAERHLETCPLCLSTLEILAGGPGWWTEVRDLLSDDGDERPSLRAAGIRLDMLAPTERAGSLGRLGGYEVEGVVGRGGMGVVLKAFDPALQRVVAIKVMAEGLASNGAARRRFAREAQAAAAVEHEHVLAVHAVAADAELPYLVMAYVSGKSLQERIDRDGPLPLRDILRIGLQTARGLAAAHAQGLVHRDVKPANILLENGVERVRLTDFGLARAADDASMTRSGVIAGTPPFMAPEQARGETCDHRADLFSLGSVLYTMATGRLPFRAETAVGVLRKVSDADPEPIRRINPDVPAWLVKVIAKLHRKQPAERYRTAEEVADVLAACLAHVEQPEQRRLPTIPRGPFRGRRWTLATAAVVVFAGAAWGAWQVMNPKSTGGGGPTIGPPPAGVTWDEDPNERAALRVAVERIERAARDWPLRDEAETSNSKEKSE